MVQALKYFTLTTFSVIYNTAPILTLVFGASCLGEKVTIIDYMIVLLGFVAVGFIIYGIFIEEEHEPINKNSKKYAQHDHFSVIGIVTLVLTPVLASLNNIIVRRLRKINENTLSCYSNIACATFGFVFLEIYELDSSFVIKIVKS